MEFLFLVAFYFFCETLVNSDGTTVNTEDLTNKVSAGANYLGSIFSNAWSKTTKTANEATATSSNFLTSTFNKVGTAASSAGKCVRAWHENNQAPPYLL